MPVGKRSPSRGSARKVNAVVSPIGDDTGAMETQQRPVRKSGITTVSGSTGSSRARKATSTTEDAVGDRSRAAANASERPPSSRSPNTIPEGRRPKRSGSSIAQARERAAARRDDAEDMAFFGGWGHGNVPELEEMGQDFAEQFLTAVTSGQETHAEAQDRIWEMELGGPFVISSDKRELGRGRRGMDGFESEAFPTPSAPPSVPAPDELDDEQEEED